MLCVDYLRPAAIRAGVKLEDGQRFGFHNLRHSLASFLVTKGCQNGPAQHASREKRDHVGTLRPDRHG
jgi:integrase